MKMILQAAIPSFLALLFGILAGMLIAKTSFIREMFDPKGTVSWGRVGSFVIMNFLIIWISYPVFTEPAPSQVLKELPWSAFALFLGMLYGIGKGGEAVESFNKGRDDDKP